MTLVEILAFVKANPREIAEFVGILAALLAYFLQVWNGRLKLNEAILLLVNTLKVEDKMTSDGKFNPDLVEKKLIAVGTTIGAAQATVEEVKKVMQTSQGSSGLKIGSYKGKPITVDQVLGAGSILGGFLKILKK